MSRSVPIRDLAGKIVALSSDKAVDPVQETLDASLKAVGVTPQPEPAASPGAEPRLPPQRPSRRATALGVER